MNGSLSDESYRNTVSKIMGTKLNKSVDIIFVNSLLGPWSFLVDGRHVIDYIKNDHVGTAENMANALCDAIS
jgi:hypothetical protein